MVLHKNGTFLYGLENGYHSLLKKFMAVRWLALIIVIICFGVIYFIGREFLQNLPRLKTGASSVCR